ncbi:PH domain-containing protein [Halorubrum ezzemoulense]|uniref:PH domain-containing protein n=1 Tax=Halorubrum ezzemoulense TaxID=337243 RepID=UPI00232F18AA|nr:PH domain-containing protein [Halorubrum ezzemoulense]MDB2239309.1 PH domain-containing protein [Halorubrum ezzemoulense]MDB2249782.1 PH domain-containing protein [Halorubrum ezzemoulense]
MSEETGHEASTAGINPLDGESVLKNVHPSWINWKGRLFSALFFAVIGLMISGDIGAFLVVVGLFQVLSTFLSRRASRYIVTNQRVKKKIGLLGSSTQEARLDSLNGISTDSGFIEGIFGKGTVSVTDAARETLAIKGVGNYQDLARTLREQQRQTSQPGRAGYQQQPPGGQQSQSPQSQSASGSAASGSEPPANGSEAETDEGTSRERCLSCGSLIDDSAGFCPECGAEEPFSPPTASDDDDDDASGSAADDASSNSEPEFRDHPVVDAADAVASRERPDDDAARELCRVLADPDVDRRSVESALRDAVGAIEEAEEGETEPERSVPDGLAGLGESPTANQLESARGRLLRSDHPAASATLPVVDRAIQLEAERDQAATERDRYREAVESICDAAARGGAVSFTASDPDARAEELVKAVERGDAVIESPGTAWESAAAEIERSQRPQTTEARDLLNAFETNDTEEITASLGAAVEGLEELGELRSGIMDIEERDIQRRIDSLEEELGRTDGSVYRHLADRVRELEAMANEPDVDEVQLYAIYQECTFYDRTLVPRLSRSDSSSESVDIARRARDVEDRIASVNDEYVSVRADHNHTIPKHFLDLADTLCDRARRMGDEQPHQAAGQLAAASDLLDHVEELYERNEYSVMLRRLRG